MTFIWTWPMISDPGYFLTKRAQNNIFLEILRRFVSELLLILHCNTVIDVNRISSYIGTSLTENQVKNKKQSGCGARG